MIIKYNNKFKEPEWDESIVLYNTPREWCIVEDPTHTFKAGALWDPNIDPSVLMEHNIKFGYFIILFVRFIFNSNN